MPTTLTESSTFDANIQVPASGEARTAASVSAPFQKLTNRSKYLLDALASVGTSLASIIPANGTIVWDRKLHCFDANAIVIGAIKSVYIGGVKYSSLTPTSFDAGAAGVGANVWYYLYAYISSGSLAFQASTTVPDSGHVFKNGTTTHVYLGAFRTNGSSAVECFITRGNKTHRCGSLGATYIVDATANATSFAVKSLAAFMPPTSYLASLEFTISNNGANSTTLTVRAPSGSSSYVYYGAIVAGAQGTYNDDIEAPTQQIEYQINSGSGTFYATIHALGYYE